MKAATFDCLSFALALACLLLLVFLPLWLIYAYQAEGIGETARTTGEVTVGVAVVLRATVRRWFRTGSRNLLRSTLGTYSRASARTLTRRMIKSASRILMGSLLKNGAKELDTANGTAKSSLAGLLIGFPALCLSFWGVLAMQTHDDLMNITQDGAIPIWLAALVGGAPLLAYAAIVTLAGRVWGIKVQFQTAIDGLLLQSYFTGAGSFLPMTTDVEYVGRAEAKPRVAAVALGSLYAAHLGLLAAANWTGSHLLLLASTMFLTYCFVFSFPIRPFEGYYLWSRSKLLWLIFWIPILASFIGSLPESFAELL
ncbi:MAG: hypothetical protein KJ000_30630 [Pirellulaceae bacterium]|nr:hypothetical protein [Pirellulaceae bacterium]